MNSSIRFIAPVLIGSVLSAAVFGVFIMMGSGHAMTGCAGGIGVGTPCAFLGSVAHLESHLRTFQGISTAVLAMVALGALLLVTLFAHDDWGSSRLKQVSFFGLSYDLADRGHSYSFLHWLTLHEKRDPAFLRVVDR